MLRLPLLPLAIALALSAGGSSAAQAGLEDRLPAPLLLVTASDPSPFLHMEKGLTIFRALRDPNLDMPGLQALLAEIDALRGPIVLALLSLNSVEGRPPIPQLVLGVDLGKRAAEVEALLRGKFAPKDLSGGPRTTGAGLRAESRRIAGHDVLAFLDSSTPDSSTRDRGDAGLGQVRDGPMGGGSRLLVTFFGTTLVVASSQRTLERILGDQETRSRDPRIASLRSELGSRDGSLFVFADWKKLHAHVLALLPRNQRLLYQASGLPGLDCVGIDVHVENGGFKTKARFHFAGERTGLAALLRPETRTRRFAEENMPGRLAQVQLHLDKEHAITALARAFGSGQVRAETAVSCRGRLAEGARSIGLDLDREVLARLGERLTVEIVLARPDSLQPEVFVALDGASPKEASALVRSIAERLVPTGLAAAESLGEDRRIVKLSPRLLGKGTGAIEIGNSGPKVLVGFSEGGLVRYAAAAASRKPAVRTPRDVPASGFLDLDDGELAARIGTCFARDGGEPAPTRAPASSCSGSLTAETDGFSLELVARPAKG